MEYEEIEELGDAFIALGSALKDRRSSIGRLAELAFKCGLELKLSVATPESEAQC